MKMMIMLMLLSSMAHAKTATIAFVGDINFTGRIAEAIDKHGTTWPFDKVKDVLAEADYRVGNLESPAGVGGTEFPDKRVLFRVNPQHLDALTYGGFNLVSLANNHALDYGPEVLDQTKSELTKRGILYTGVRENNIKSYEPTIVNIKGFKVAFLGYCNACPWGFAPTNKKPGVNVGLSKMIKAQVKKLISDHNPDFIVAMPHWGTEYGGVDKNQEFTNRALIESGVDVVIGAHPHVLQKVSHTILGNGEKSVTAYSLGNFIFPMRWKTSMDSGILMVTLTGNGGDRDITTTFVPVSLDTNRPELVDPGSDRFKRDQYIYKNGYDFTSKRHWPERGPWHE